MKKKEKTPYKIPTITKTQQKKRLMGYPINYASVCCPVIAFKVFLYYRCCAIQKHVSFDVYRIQHDCK